jgi:hypothetical protein
MPDEAENQKRAKREKIAMVVTLLALIVGIGTY